MVVAVSRIFSILCIELLIPFLVGSGWARFLLELYTGASRIHSPKHDDVGDSRQEKQELKGINFKLNQLWRKIAFNWQFKGPRDRDFLNLSLLCNEHQFIIALLLSQFMTFLLDSSQIIALPCQSVSNSLLFLRLDWCDPGVWRSRNLSLRCY